MWVEVGLMRMRYLGDSYDVVKHAMLGWLAPLGAWFVHPMFSEIVTQVDCKAYEDLLGIPSISTTVLTVNTNRRDYFSCAEKCDHLFLDPDTGLRMKTTQGRRAPEFLFGEELLHLCKQRPRFLTLVFDQSLPRGSEEKSLRKKLQELSERGVSGFAYVSHACFLFASCDHSLIAHTRQKILTDSQLPDKRLMQI
ncbi:MAG: hypothetical protein ACYC9M_10005 [Desulfobulbaceae bacterium]